MAERAAFAGHQPGKIQGSEPKTALFGIPGLQDEGTFQGKETRCLLSYERQGKGKGEKSAIRMHKGNSAPQE